MRATLIVSYQSPGRYAFNVLVGSLEADELAESIDLVVARSRETLLEATRASVERGAPTIVAWSFYSASLAGCAAEHAWLREHVPHGWTSLAGGVHASAEPEETLRAGFERVAIGEGEHTLREIVRALASGSSIDSVRGVARLEGEEMLVDGRGTPVDELDRFPPFAVRRRLWGPIEITRGCIYACKFCQTPFLAKARFRHRSAPEIARWASEIRRAGMRDVRFVSPTSLSYGSPDERVDLAAIEDLLARVRAAIGDDGRLFFGTFPSEVRPEHVTPEVLAILARYVDNDNLVIGGQSGSARVLAHSHRGHDVESIERAVRVAVEAGFVPNVDFLLGLPGEEEEDAQATVELIESLTALGARAHGHTFMPLPGTPFRHSPAGRVDERTRARLTSLEGRGSLYGQWRQQEELARRLVRPRNAARRESG